MLEWIKVIGPIICSWPVIGLLALVIFRKQLLWIIEQFTSSQSWGIKVGPVEFERKLTNLADKVEEQETEQERQQSELETITLLLVHFVSEHELSHLKKLASDEPFIFQKTATAEHFFQPELRHLVALGFIANHPGKGIGPLFLEQGDVKNHFYVTEAGKKYLELRESLQQQLTQPDSIATH